MRTAKDNRPSPKKPSKPGLEKQKDEFAKQQDFHFYLPQSFVLLCKLWNVPPASLLADFMDNLGCGSRKQEGREAAREFLKCYAIEMGYGRRHYTRADIEKMFAELQAVGMLWPENADMKFMNMHARWRYRYYNWWFKKWYRKYQRKPTSNPNRPA